MNLKFVALVLLFATLVCSGVAQKLEVGYYGDRCPRAESIVQKAVFKAVSANPGIAAGLIRMHFHDCFVRGCDGSVLLDQVPGGPQVEKQNPVNFPSLRGFEVIDEAKKKIEAICPGKVSCADILAFASRDSAFKTGWIWYAVPAGRRDGNVSLFPEVFANLPPPFFNATQLRDNFLRKGLSLDEMVTLSGSHSIGVSHCSSFSNRLRNFSATNDQDPSLNPSFAASLRNQCPVSPQADPPVVNDIQTATTLDNKYYVNLKYQKGLLTSDQTLFDSPLTRKLVVNNAKYGSVWAKKFGAATVRMGAIDVLTGKQGEIRKNCRLVNK
jgi:peroxidase